MRANELLAEIQRLYTELRARPDFGYSNGSRRGEGPSGITLALEDQIRTLSDRYKRQTEFTTTTTTDDQSARGADSQYQAASP